MVNKIMFETGLPDFIDERVEKIQAKLEKLNPEFLDMAEELEKIGWDLENSYKGLWESSNIRLQHKHLKALVYKSLPMKTFTSKQFKGSPLEKLLESIE